MFSRSWLGALAVAFLAVVIVGRSVWAEPPPAMEARDLAKVIDALKKSKGRRSDLASVRFYAEVFDGTTIRAPVGSAYDVLGPWSDNGALMDAEARLSGCAGLPPERQKAASALLKEYGTDLPVLLRAYTMAGEGQKKEATELFVATFEASAIATKSCPSEHPMYSHRRVGRMQSILACVKTIDPQRDVKALEQAVERARFCAANNHAVG
jgi:hypothetical protein